MKSTGITRPIDNLGRVVIPKELRKSKGLDVGDRMEFFVECDRIIIQKYVKGCHCCESHDATIEMFGLKICDKCLDDFNKARELINKLR